MKRNSESRDRSLESPFLKMKVDFYPVFQRLLPFPQVTVWLQVIQCLLPAVSEISKTIPISTIQLMEFTGPNSAVQMRLQVFPLNLTLVIFLEMARGILSSHRIKTVI